MTEERYVCDEDIEFEESGIADRIELEESESVLCVKEVCDLLNKQDKTIKFLRYLLGYYYDKDEIDKMIMGLI